MGVWRLVWRRLWAGRSARGALTLLAVLATLAAAAPLIAPYKPNAQGNLVTDNRRPPSADHPFGTDRFSRDVLSRVMYGGRLSLAIALLAVALSATIGTTYGAVAGFYGGWLDAVMMRLLDALLAPHDERPGLDRYAEPAPESFPAYRTFCGT